MARGRIIANDITKDKRVSDLSDDTSRLAFTWLVTFADCEGRTHGDPALIRSILFPRREDITIKQMEVYIREWADLGLVIWYECNGDKWIQFPAFAKHQKGFDKRHEPDSVHPPPPDVPDNVQDGCADDVRTTPVQCTAEEKRSEVNRNEDADKDLPALSGDLTTGQRYFLSSFGAKRFQTKIQRETVGLLEQQYGLGKLQECVDWAAKVGMSRGRAVVSIEKAIKTWNDSGKVDLR